MARGKSIQETEIKLAVASAAAGRRLLRAARFKVGHRRTRERNTLYDTGGQSLRRSGQLLRLRQYGDDHVLTYKGPARVAQHRVREELEFTLSDSALAGSILERLGFQPTFRYEKYRTEYRRDGERGLATLDETPAGTFLELEGAPRWIDRTARQLGFSPGDYITASYASLWMDYCAERGWAAGDMLFPSASGDSLSQS